MVAVSTLRGTGNKPRAPPAGPPPRRSEAAAGAAAAAEARPAAQREAAAAEPAPRGDAAAGQNESWLPPLAALAAWAALSLPWAWAFLDVAPYMDEIFHVPQAQRYCEGRLFEWDPKITTFPGLYFFSAAPWLPGALLRQDAAPPPSGGPPPEGAAAASAAGSHERCPVQMLRATNLLFGAGCVLLLYRLMSRRMGAPKAAANALVLSLFPTHFFYTFLYYTDVGSLFWTLLTHHLATPLRGRGLRSPREVACAALAGLAAIAFRQTNAVWVMFTFGTAVLADLQCSPKWGARLGGSGSNDAALTLTVLVDFVQGLLLESRRLLWRFGSLLVPVLLFVVFVIKNGSVVVGDHSNHQAVTHWAQLAYLSAITASFWGVVGCDGVVSPSSVKAFMSTCLARGDTSLRAGLLMGTMYILLRRYSYAHPFLLADNRHYTFYVWNRFLGRLPWLREALAPVYLYCGWLCYTRLGRAQTSLWFLIWCFACVLTLVPAHLLEPRYFTAAVMLAHAHAPERSWASLAVSGAACMLVNAATLLVFLHRPFVGPDGELARFMW